MRYAAEVLSVPVHGTQLLLRDEGRPGGECGQGEQGRKCRHERSVFDDHAAPGPCPFLTVRSDLANRAVAAAGHVNCGPLQSGCASCSLCARMHGHWCSGYPGTELITDAL